MFLTACPVGEVGLSDWSLHQNKKNLPEGNLPENKLPNLDHNFHREKCSFAANEYPADCLFFTLVQSPGVIQIINQHRLSGDERGSILSVQPPELHTVGSE